MGYLILDTCQRDYLGFLLWEQVQATDEVWSRVGGFRANLQSCEMCKVAENPDAFFIHSLRWNRRKRRQWW